MSATFSEDTNIGSIRSIRMALARQLNSLNPVTFTGDSDWMDIDFLPESANLDDNSKDAAPGTEYGYQLTFAFNKQNAALFEAFKPYIGTFGIVEVTDSNGLSRRLGTLKNPVTIAHKAATGAKYNSLNYYQIAVSWVNDKAAVVV